MSSREGRTAAPGGTARTLALRHVTECCKDGWLSTATNGVAVEGSWEMIAEVSVRAFDCHLTLDALLRAGDLSPGFAWLGDIAGYRRRLFADAERLGSLHVTPWHGLHRHPFWGRFRQAVEAKAGAGLLLMPVVCRPERPPVRLRSTVVARQPVLRRSVWLWPFGWSSEVRLKAVQPFALDDLQPLLDDAIGSLETLAGPSGRPTRTSLSRVFQGMSDDVLAAAWTDANRPLASRKIDRFSVLTVKTTQRPEVLRFARRPPAARQWPDADRAKVYALACNAPAAPSRLAALKAKTTFIDLEAGSFVVLDLAARRMIVFLTVSRRAPGQWLDCAEANLVDFLRQALVLHHAVDALDKGGGRSAIAAELAGMARSVLAELGDTYASPFARKLVEVQRWNQSG